MSKQIVGLVEFCQEQGMNPLSAAELMRTLNDRHVLDMARHEARVMRVSGSSQQEAKPLADEGDDFGFVEARGIPGKLFFQLHNQKNFGAEGFTSDEGMKDFLKAYPQFRVKTVSGKITGVGFGCGRHRVKNYG